MAQTSLQMVLAERPTGHIVPGKTFHQKSVPVPTEADLKDGQVLVETLYLSLDPAMRAWLNESRSYVEPVKLGDVMRGYSLARVLAAKSTSVKPGDLVTAVTGFQEVAILPANEVQPAVLPKGGRITDLLGVLGLTGLTAYMGLEKIGQPKKGETVVVSAAAGATGSVVAQMAKLRGARVVGLAGTDEKVGWLKDHLGLDVALNYRDKDIWEKFKAATPDYIDVYWDNVGGEQLDMALRRAKNFARFVMCGMISQYNNSSPTAGPKSMTAIVMQRIRMQGFIVTDYASEFPSAQKQLAEWLSEAKIKRQETILKGGLKMADEAICKLFEGHNTGKLLLEVKDPEEKPRL